MYVPLWQVYALVPALILACSWLAWRLRCKEKEVALEKRMNESQREVIRHLRQQQREGAKAVEEWEEFIDV